MDRTLEEIAQEETEARTDAVVFTERMRPGYAAVRNEELTTALQNRQGTEEQWQPLGPDNVGGRVTCLISTSPDGKALLAGAACGGVWSGTVTGEGSGFACEWKANCCEPEDSNDLKVHLMYNIGALAVHGQTIYCGTGHAYHAGDSFPGVGLFRSKDNGKTWKLIKEAGKDFPQRISTIAVDRNRVWIGGVVLPDREEEVEKAAHSGIFYSKDQGVHWQRLAFKLEDNFTKRVALSKSTFGQGIFKDRDYQCHSIVLLKNSKTADPVILAAISAPLNWGGIWRSRDLGVSWEQLKRGLPEPREFGRTTLAVAPSDDGIVYAFIGARDGRCLGVFRSSDSGSHWVSREVEHFAACGSLNYVNCLVVHPENPDIVVCGARDLHRSIDGGQTWTQVTEWFAKPESRAFSHADHHALLWPQKELLYSGNDGGVDVSADEGITWKRLNTGLAIAMFYDIDVAPSFMSRESNSDGIPDLIIAGGTQDNASIITDFRTSGVGYVPTSSGIQIGFTTAMIEAFQGMSAEQLVNVDESGITNPPGKPATAFHSLLSGGKPQNDSSQTLYGVRTKNLKPTRIFKHELFGDGGWIVFDPNDPLHIYGSSQNMAVYRHRRDNGWQTVTPAGADDDERNGIWMAIITMHPEDPNIIFTGSTRVWRTNNDGEDWAAVSDHLDGSPITAIEIADHNPNFIYVGTESGNIFKSEDGGNRWNDQPGETFPKPMDWRNDLGERLAIGVARTVTRIEAHPQNATNVVATLMGFTGKRHHLPHVIWFDPKKKKWSPVERDDDRLPNVHHNVITWGGRGEYVFVGNDIGVWAKKTPGGDFGRYPWHDISGKLPRPQGNLPNAIVTDLVYHCKTESLTAATYGRSLWWTDKKTWADVKWD